MRVSNMNFIDDVLVTDSGTDSRLCKLLFSLHCSSGETVDIDSLLVAAVVSRDPSILDVVGRSLHPGIRLEKVLCAIESKFSQSKPLERSPRLRGLYCPEAVTLIEGVHRSLAANDIPLESQLEYFILRVMQNTGFGKSGRWADLDRDRAIDLLERRIEGRRRNDAKRTAGRDAPETVGSPPDGLAEVLTLPSEIAPSENLTMRARSIGSQFASPLDGDPQYEHVFDLLSRALFRSGGHAALVGEKGVGHNIVLADFAFRASSGRIPFLRNAQFLAVDCRYVSPAESADRLTAILRELGTRSDAVICLDGFQSLLRNGDGTNNCGLLLSLLQRVRCRVIGCLTPHSFEEFFATLSGATETFSTVLLHEPNLGVSQRIVACCAEGLKQRFHLEFDDKLIRMATVLSSNYILNERLPSKALRLLGRICEDIEYDRSQLSRGTPRVTEQHILGAVSKASGVPEETLRGIAEQSDYKCSLGKIIFGQEHAVAQVAAELGLIKAGLTEPTKPASVMLFVGQTGTGKTEMAKALARFYSISKRLRTYTLGNFSEPHSVAGIIGVPPGYVGHDQGGRLVNDLIADPYCVFLLDEADKAHPDVLQPFLNLFDEGWVRDQRAQRPSRTRRSSS